MPFPVHFSSKNFPPLSLHTSIEFIKTNHSIVDAAALAIYSPAGVVVHTGDFKVDYTPVFGDAIDLQRFAEIGKKVSFNT